MNQESIPGGNHSVAIVNQLCQGQPIRGAEYNNIILSSSEREIIDDPTATGKAKFVTLYWPGHDPETGANLATIACDKEAGTVDPGEAGRVREAILGASVGRAALRRIPIEVRRQWIRIEQKSPVPPIDKLELIAAMLVLPLVVCMTSEAANRNPGDRVMHMWYPASVQPKPALEKLQGVVRQAIDQETL